MCCGVAEVWDVDLLGRGLVAGVCGAPKTNFGAFFCASRHKRDLHILFHNFLLFDVNQRQLTVMELQHAVAR